MRRAPRTFASAGLVVLAAACAKVGRPPGGPEDRLAPEVVEVIPPPGAAAVSPDSAVMIVFSENPDRRSVTRALVVFPPVDFRGISWEEGTLRLVPEGGWSRQGPTILRIGRSARDRRGNEMAKAFQTRFTTEAVPDSGEATGRAWRGREAPGNVPLLVLAYPIAPGDTLDPDRVFPVAVVEAEPDGEFRLGGLDVAGTYRVAGLVDRDGDVRPSPRGEAWGVAPEPVRFPDPLQPTVRVPDFLVGTLDSAGTLAGEVRVDSGSVAVVFADREGDDERRVAVLPGGGAFSLSVPTGARYRIAAFVDADGDTLPGAEEHRVELEESVSLELTSEQSGFLLDLSGPGEGAPGEENDAAEAGETPGPDGGSQP